MRVLLVHNSYQQRGGEDTVFEAERDLLRQNGVEVIEYTAHNDAIEGMSRASLLANTIWSRQHYRGLRRAIQEHNPHVAHFHNTLPLISPSGYYAARRSGVPVVQTLHNYRMLCPSALLFRDGEICRDCVGKVFPSPAVRHKCYRGSAAASGAVASMLAVHRMRGTFDRVVDRYIVLTEFARQEFVAGGLPADRLVVKPNFVAPDPGRGDGERHGVLFVGRLTPEKGISVLLQAAKSLSGEQLLTIVGDGPLRGEVERAAADNPRIKYLGEAGRDQVVRCMKSARALAVCSTWFEGFPVTILEAFACGLPVLASDLGSMSSIVAHERNGLLVEPGSAEAWSAALVAGSDAPLAWGARARTDYVTHYSAAQNFEQLMAVYESVCGVRVRRPAVTHEPVSAHSPPRAPVGT